MRASGLLLAAVWTGMGCGDDAGPADGGCVPATCAAGCAELGYGDSVCTAGICRCLAPFDADADADGDDAARDDVGVADEATAEEVGPEDVGGESACEGFDAAGVSGTYHGTFAGTISSPIGDGPMEGDVDFVMTETSPGAWSFDGTMSGTAMGGAYPWSCRVQGLGDCGRIMGMFYDGTVEIERVTYGFEGTLASSFEPYRFPDGGFSGRCTDCPFEVTGVGTWTASHL